LEDLAVSGVSVGFEPFRGVPSYAEPIVFAIGLAAINWGKMDQHLEYLLRHIDDADYITGKIERFPDTSFRIKSQLFKKWYAKHEYFRAVHHIAKPVCLGLKKANASRILIFHSNIQGFFPGPPAQVEVFASEAEGDTLKTFTGLWTAQDINEFTALVCQLSDDLSQISQAVMHEDFRKSLRKE
jgi:hypothetical protein